MQMELSFLGAAQNVTGSRHLLSVDGYNILVDCGLYQERHFLDRNWATFPVPASDIDAVLITHAHLDHCGLLPKLVNEGFRGRIYCTTATAEIAEIILLDSAHIQVEDAAYKKKRHEKEGRKGPHPEIPLYNVQDVEATLPLFHPVRYEEITQLTDGIRVSFHDAGHILGAAMIKVVVQKGSEHKTVLFSGDVGRWNKPILNDPTIFSAADYVLVESTYGDRIHEDTENTKQVVAEVINSTYKRGGNIIIPSFSVERAQEIIYCLNKLLLEDKVPPLLVFLDSPMAIRVTEVFKKHPEMFDKEMLAYINNGTSPFNLPGLQMTRTTNESKAINNIKGTITVIAGSGMCTGGRIKHHLVNNITRPECTVLFAGYQANGTLGRIIVDGKKQVRIHGQMFPVNARIERIHGLSGHADRDELLRWLKGLQKPPRQVFVVHGEETAAKAFRDYVQEKTGWNVKVPAYMDRVELR